GQVLPALHDDVAIPRVQLSARAGPVHLFGCHDARSGTEERVERSLPALRAVAHQVGEQRRRLHRGVVRVPLRLVEVERCRLLAVREPTMRAARRTAVEAGLMLPLIVLPPEDERVLDPDQALPDALPEVAHGAAEVVALAVGVPDVEARAGV